MALIARTQFVYIEKEVQAYARAGSVAEEMISAVRTVVAFGGEKKAVEKYDERLEDACRAGIVRSAMAGLGAALLWLIVYSSYGLAFWYGIRLVMDDREKCEQWDDPDEECYVHYDSDKLLVVR